MKLKCPYCGGDNMKQITDEKVQCQNCGFVTDIYEAMKQAEGK